MPHNCPNCGAECRCDEGTVTIDACVHWHVCDSFDDDPHDVCSRCGGEGCIEYNEAGPDVWGEDCPSEVNHLVVCPDCGGS